MGIAISEDHLELAGVADAFLERSGARAEARALLDAPEESLPASWKEMADLGWLGLHLPEAHGGSGFGLAELVIVVEALGAAIAPGPFLPTVWASAVIAAAGSEAQRAALLPGLADGSVPAAVGLDERDGLVLGAGLAELFLLPRGDDLVVAHRDEVTVTVPANTDATRRVGTGDARRRHRATTACSPAPAAPRSRSGDCSRRPRPPAARRRASPWPASTPRCASSSGASSACSRR